MSEADVQLYQSWAEQFAVAEDPIDFFCGLYAPEIDYRAIEGAPDDVGPIIGPDAMRAYHGEWYETFSDFTVATVEVHDAGPGRVIAVLQIGGTARESGVPVEMQFSVLYTIRDGKIVRGREYLTTDEAKRAAGLAE